MLVLSFLLLTPSDDPVCPPATRGGTGWDGVVVVVGREAGTTVSDGVGDVVGRGGTGSDGE